jgi:hypothetical protein
MHWCIQVNWNGNWVTVDQGYKTQDDAEWAAGKWKSANKCFGDPFRAVQIEGVALINVFADTRPPQVVGMTNFPNRTTPVVGGAERKEYVCRRTGIPCAEQKGGTFGASCCVECEGFERSRSNRTLDTELADPPGGEG